MLLIIKIIKLIINILYLIIQLSNISKLLHQYLIH